MRHQWRIIHSESEIGWGGQEHRILAELAGFRRRGAQVALLASTHSQIFQRAVAAGIPVRSWRVERSDFPLSMLRTALWLRRQSVQILNTHSSRDGWIAGIAGRLARVPLIVRTRHIEVSYPNRWLSRHAYCTLPHHVLTTSRKIAQHFQDFFGLPPERVSAVPTGIDLNRFSPDGEIADLGSKPKVTTLIGMVSVLRSWKGHRTFIQASRRLKDAGLQAQTS